MPKYKFNFNKAIAPLSMDNWGGAIDKGVKAVSGAAKGIGRSVGGAVKGIESMAGKATGGVGRAISNAVPGQAMFQKHANQIKSYKKGGKVKKTGLANLHKGERVLKVSDAKKFEKMKRKVFGIKNYGKNK